MELRHLTYFMKLAEELHYGKASEKLFIAQPALSRQIKELENELDVVLFDRNKRKVVLTAAGMYLYKQSSNLFSQLTETKRELKRIHNGEVGLLRIGYVATAMYSVLPESLSTLKNEREDLQLRIAEMTTLGQVQAVKNGTIDVGFVRCPLNDQSVKKHIVLRESFTLVMPANHPLANAVGKDLSVLKNEPFVFFPRTANTGYFDQTISLCYQAGFSPNIQYEGTGSNILVQMVASGLGITILPSSIAGTKDERVKCIELDFTNEKAELAMIYDEKRLPEELRRMVLNAAGI
ncbi:LysR family transcriptional regulator [Solitalea canadensis]|uniref:Transcriptional regulator n=1 Tax=Solitalea canadensis (strain ATCC 29591 / DSM 3403 / JCM 21819 / LMG 8368 / NBRC 15130 / NCIMB 12057 / USAM 9D) TaxID=929556 RepID=H8KNW9_SOLCM|nr:LysR family transcriptional regulator [Solitalea canadensis]AFD05380.1 transcriptional regulator [Solitalea canadensis DSM 3403]